MPDGSYTVIWQFNIQGPFNDKYLDLQRPFRTLLAASTSPLVQTIPCSFYIYTHNI